MHLNQNADPTDPTEDGHGEVRSPSERVYRGILRALYEGAIVPGQRLAAPDLMQQFNTGRGTIREVLHRLTSTGVVSIVPNRGAQVRIMSRTEIDELLDIVEALLALAASRAAGSIKSEGAADTLKLHHAAIHRLGSPADFHEFVRAREEYYRCIVRLSGNRELQRLFPAAQVHIMRVQLRRFQNAADTVAISDFEELTKAILWGDPQRAEEAAKDHVGYTRKRVAALPDDAFAKPRQ